MLDLYHNLYMDDLKLKANILRALCLISTTTAGSGHPTSCLSAADLTAVLFDRYFSFDIKNPKNLNNDQIIFSKGHAAPLLYSAFALTGALKREELLTLRKFGSRLEGHPTPVFEFCQVATGSLGQGLSSAAGIAFSLRSQIQNSKLENQNMPKVYALLGDGEVAEGQIYEACNFASKNNLNNLITIVDINGLGQTGKTAFYHDLTKYENIFYSLGFITLTIDGNNIYQIESALKEATNNKSDQPFMILAKTVKGKGISFLENREDFHGKTLNEEDLEKALDELCLTKEILKDDSVLFTPSLPATNKANKTYLSDEANDNISLKNYDLGEEVATRRAFGDTLVWLGSQNDSVIVLDADVGNSTFTNKFKEKFPDRFIECFIAEQNAVSVGVGLSAYGKIPFISTFAAFLTRAFDQIRMARISNSNIKFVGTHAGISVGEDGPSQMGLEDISMFASITDSIVLQPADAVSCQKLTQKIAYHKGISYLRLLRPKTKVIYNSDEEFEIGKSKVLKKSDQDLLVVVASGITVFEALEAYGQLLKEGICMCVIDAYSLKPIDKDTIVDNLSNCQKRIIISIEDHYAQGGLGDLISKEFVNENIEQFNLCVNNVPSSGEKNSLFHKFGIDAQTIIELVRSISKKYEKK
ncbi:transketolase [Candidatus Parcubacteria bacterium]|nr:MAG: transketolase [Candidatus Parcubacteria bacterium]